MKKYLYFTFLSTAFVLMGCGTTPSKNSKEWIEVTCSGFADWSNCHQKAKYYCPNGYEIANKEESMISQKRAESISCQ